MTIYIWRRISSLKTAIIGFDLTARLSLATMAEKEDFDCARLLLLLSHHEGKLDDEELLLLNLALDEDEDRASKGLGRHSTPCGPRLDLDSLSDQRCLEFFRFTRPQIRDLCRQLELPAVMTADNGIRWAPEEGFCILLRRLAYPCRLVDLEDIFGRHVSDLSRIGNCVCLFIVQRWGHLATNFTQAAWFTHERLQHYAAAVGAKCPLANCWFFLDGTIRPMCRPEEEQRAFYNGQKRVHCLKYQSVVTPDGLVAHLYGPTEGRRHDSGMLRESGLLQQLENHMPVPPEGGSYCVFADQAYPLRPQIMVPFRGNDLTVEQAAFNRQMSAVRISVEWGFQKILQYFPFVDFKKNMKLLLQPIGAYYICATILTNCHTCLNRSETSYLFDVAPPSLAEYLA